jgi:hypothetical protein
VPQPLLRIRNFGILGFTFVFAVGIHSRTLVADEGGVGFWMPGQFGSLVAVHSPTGWAFPVVYNHPSAAAGAGTSFRRGAEITAGLVTRSDLVQITPTYTFSSLVAGGQAGVSLAFSFGPAEAGVNAILFAPAGRSFSVAKQQSLVGVSDLYPSATLKWQRGNNNYMIYTMEGVPTGSYSVSRIANIGLNHWSSDAGGAYTYFDNANEFSAALGFTYNFENPATHYQNGANSHLDWAASHFVSQPTHLGVVGYSYYQLTGDTGTGAVLGAFKSRVSALGPQVGHSFGNADNPWYVNIKAYSEFGARHRAVGWNIWVTVGIP